MKLGNKFLLPLLIILNSITISLADEKISSTPLINVQDIKPSFEDSDEDSENVTSVQNLKEKKK